MIRPGIDDLWLEARDFVKQHLQSGDRLLAPPKFKETFANVSTYNATYSQTAEQFDWILFHKGLLSKVERGFVKQTIEHLQPVFANEVFVIFAKRSDLSGQSVDARHLQSFLDQVNPQERLKRMSTKQSGRLRPLRKRIRKWLGTDAEVQSSQLSAILDCIERVDHNTKQLHTLLERVQSLEQTVNNQPHGERPQVRPVGNIATLTQVSWQEFHSLCRDACRTTYLGNHQVLCRILGAYFLYGDTTDIGIVPHLCFSGYWEPWLTLAMLRTIKPGWRCLDVGANHGYYALAAAGIVGPSGRVVALEPNFKLVELIKKSLEVNGFNDRAKVMAVAASNRSGDKVNLVVPAGNTGHASIHRGATAADEVMEVETVTLDQLTADWQRVDLIKIDTEGAEEAIWQGMRQTIRNSPDIVIILEFGPERYADPRAFLEDIQAEGFILRYVDYNSQIQELTIERCLTERPGNYWDLFLQRH